MCLYNRPRVANTRLKLILVPRCLGTKSPRSWSKILILYGVSRWNKLWCRH